MDAELFKMIKRHFGTMDDLCQQRRKVYTSWVSDRMDPGDFVATMRENLRRTREVAATLEELVGTER